MAEQRTASTRAEAVVDALGLLYHNELDPDEFMLFPENNGAVLETDGEVSDWHETFGGRDGFECLVRTILSQNTSDSISKPAHENLLEHYDSECEEHDLAESLASAVQSELADTIRSAGLYNQKSKQIIGAAEWVLAEFGSAARFNEFVVEENPDTVRESLLDINGVGPKTADCVLLFAGGRDGVFPVDTHVHRIARRMGLAPPDADHEEVRERLEETVPGDKCGFGHTAMIQFGREYCSAQGPACLDDPEACPLVDICDQVGIDMGDNEAVDPAEMNKPL